MKILRLTITVFFLFILSGCEENDTTLLSGDIIGNVELVNENNYPLQDMSGVHVSLIDDTTTNHSYTDQTGRFIFQNIQYGNYQIDLEKTGFLKSDVDYSLHHLGGYSPTLVKYWLYEIPKFELVIDSLEFDGKYYRSTFYFEMKGSAGLPRYGYFIRCFCSDNPDISKDNYVSTDAGWISSSDTDGQFATGYIYLFDYRFNQLVSDTIYIRTYPQAWGQDLYEYNPESLGKPSNVISFMVE